MTALVVAHGRAPFYLRCKRTAHAHKDCHVPRCDVCRWAGPSTLECVRTYASVIPSSDGDDSFTDHQMDEQEVKLATRGAPLTSDLLLGTTSTLVIELHPEASMDDIVNTLAKPEVPEMKPTLAEVPLHLEVAEVQRSDEKTPQVVSAKKHKVRTRAKRKEDVDCTRAAHCLFSSGVNERNP